MASVAVNFVEIFTKIITFSTMEKYTMSAKASWLGAFFAGGLCRTAWFPCKQEKQNLFSAENFARYVGAFCSNTEHFHKACLPFERLQDGYSNSLQLWFWVALRP